ncbi:hypothetical protein B0H13DRAFT_2314773 [Mycena leptocephala]|nr:hypothetical protein B0H13DRAFT_2314773 [Mycena leptocephala]
MERLRKLSKAFHKDSHAKGTQASTSPTKPIYRGAKPLTVSDIHSHSPLREKQFGDDLFYDELGMRRRPQRANHDLEENGVLNILTVSLPLLPSQLSSPMRISMDLGSTFTFLTRSFSPSPEKVLVMIKERERTRTHEARLGQQRTPSHVMPLSSCGTSSYRRPFLGGNANFKAGPIVQRPVVQQGGVHNSVSQRAYPVTPPLRLSPQPEGQRKKPYAMPEGERKRLRSVPTKISPGLRSNEELYQAYPSAIQGRPQRQM